MPWPQDVARVAKSLAASGAWCWLDGESAVRDERRGQSHLAQAVRVVEAQRGAEHEFLAALRSGLHPHGQSGAAASAGFDGGWVVALSYEFGVGLLGLSPAHDAAPPAFALEIGTVLTLDHDARTAVLRGANEDALDRWLDQHGAALTALAPRDPDPPAQATAASAPQAETAAAWRRTAEAYREQVESCRAAIADGEAYVLCLTDRATTRVQVDPLALYLRLREQGGSVRGGILVAGGRALVSASPERFLEVHSDEIATHPIKGTRRRGRSQQEDAALAAELAADPKERAENLMIVDLMRNDLSRVCAPGSVQTRGFLRVETHPYVHQLVSTVAGRLLPGRDVFDAIAACLPGGSMTGAPKHRAVQILAELENGPRGLYSGCFGWISHSGDAELAMTIRSVELRGVAAGPGEPGEQAVAIVGAGGGITADSESVREEEERRLKAAPLLALLGPG